MDSSVSIEQRLASLEAWKAQAELVVADRPKKGGGHGPLAQPLRSPGQKDGRLSRFSFLKRAGALMAGVAGAALLEARASKEAYATTTDTNFVATGFAAGGGAGFWTNVAGLPFQWGGVLSGQTGLQATGTILPGVVAYGGSDLLHGSGVEAHGGSASGTGVDAFGGSTDGTGVRATGQGAGAGVVAQGGPNSGYGIQAIAGSPSGTAVLAQGWDMGIDAVGGATGVGGRFYGGRANLQLYPALMVGPPTTGAHNIGDVLLDARGVPWLCTQGVPRASSCPCSWGD